jgi:hypothetical protein
MKRKFLLVLLALAALMAGCGQTPDSPAGDPELEAAQQTLVDYFNYAAGGEYEQAAALMAEDPDSLDAMIANNPSVDPENRAALLEAACAFQLRCMAVLDVMSGERVSESEFTFVVQFASEDGSLFVLGPCCGADETEMPPVSEFEYTVLKEGDGYKVLGLPVYVP